MRVKQFEINNTFDATVTLLTGTTELIDSGSTHNELATAKSIYDLIGGDIDITDTQVAFSDGTKLVGSADLAWDNTLKTLTIKGDRSLSEPLLVCKNCAGTDRFVITDQGDFTASNDGTINGDFTASSASVLWGTTTFHSSIIFDNQTITYITTDLSASATSNELARADAVKSYVDDNTLSASTLSITSNQVAYGTGANELGGSDNFTYDGSTLTVLGNFTISGTTTYINTTDLNITDNLITINSGETGTGVTLLYAGIEIDRGDATNYVFLFDETQENFRIGESASPTGGTQAVATREDSPISDGIAVWNSSSYRFDTIPSNSYLSGNTSLDDLTTSITDTQIAYSDGTNLVGSTGLTYNGSDLSVGGDVSANTATITDKINFAGATHYIWNENSNELDINAQYSINLFTNNARRFVVRANDIYPYSTGKSLGLTGSRWEKVWTNKISDTTVEGALDITSGLTITGETSIGGELTVYDNIKLINGTDSFIKLGEITGNAVSQGGIVCSNYYTANKQVMAFFSYNTQTENYTYFGGGVGSYNSATQLQFWTSDAGINDTIGSKRMSITKDGIEMYVGLDVEGYLTITGDTTLHGNIIFDGETITYITTDLSASATSNELATASAITNYVDDNDFWDRNDDRLSTRYYGDSVSIGGNITGGTENQSYLSTDQMALSQLNGGAYFGRVGITENQLYLSNIGETWTAKGTTLNWYGIAMSSDGKIQTAVVDTGLIYLSSDYGETWISTGTTEAWSGIAISSDGKIQSAVIEGGYIYISSDYGYTWTAKDSSRSWKEISMSSDGKIQTAIEYNGEIFVSNDYGDTWTAKDTTRYWYDVSMSSDGKIQTAVATGNFVYISNDYGNTWTQKATSEAWRSIAMSSDGKIQTATVYGGQLYVSHADSNINGNTNVSTLTTADPSSGSAAWKLGDVITSGVTLVTTDYVEVEIGGTLYKIALVE